MADFCHACSIEHFDKDYGDLKGLVTHEEFEKGFTAAAICEGCGFIYVDPDGNCISEECSCKGMEGHGGNSTDE